MNKAELNTAVKLARSDAELPSYFGVEMAIFEGCGLPEFKPVTVTVELLAGLIRAHCCAWNGTFLDTELNELARIGRRNFTIVGMH